MSNCLRIRPEARMGYRSIAHENKCTSNYRKSRAVIGREIHISQTPPTAFRALIEITNGQSFFLCKQGDEGIGIKGGRGDTGTTGLQGPRGRQGIPGPPGLVAYVKVNNGANIVERDIIF